MKTIQPDQNGVFPEATPNEAFSLELGNGTRVTAMVCAGSYFGIETYGRYGGFYPIMVPANAGYIMEKFRLLDGDAANFADFINDQLFEPGERPRQGRYHCAV